jgi:hypothetical protein
MAALLFLVGTIFVGFGVLGWVGLLTAAPPAGRGTVAWPSAIQETPIFLSIGFGFALIAAGVVVERMDRMLRLLVASQANQQAAPSPGRSEPSIDSTDISPSDKRDQHELAARGWVVAIDRNGRWRATGKSATVIFETEREKRDGIAAELARPR